MIFTIVLPKVQSFNHSDYLEYKALIIHREALICIFLVLWRQRICQPRRVVKNNLLSTTKKCKVTSFMSIYVTPNVTCVCAEYIYCVFVCICVNAHTCVFIIKCPSHTSILLEFTSKFERIYKYKEPREICTFFVSVQVAFFYFFCRFKWDTHIDVMFVLRT